ncbi:hypothetical protein [Methylobacterium sp. E-045]|uniref:hypothetical protein n=1 Tax=Methylobacterium sp. E-045 TaxID=2836575 RepID=UPI001FB9096E|nr:hypothetical protein [Methylobacterium sp. E-045]MCJ2131625.1 hypothetical protein [Methylobacterium sp. E-045]
MSHETIRRLVVARRLGAAMLGGLSMTMALPVFAQPPSPPATVNNWAELRATLASCWSVPPDTRGSLIAFLFGITKTGELRGAPRVTARRLEGHQEARKHYEAAARDAVSRCFPVTVTPSFGAILGESPIRLRFVNTPPTAAYQINGNITIFAPP